MSYNPAIGRFLSVDPLTRSYPWYTPYQFAGNTPIQAIDLDGLEPLFINERGAERIANDINAIFTNKYGDEVSRTALKVEKTTIRQKNPDYGFIDAYLWGDDPEYINKDMWTIRPNEDFDWQRDRYTSALKDVLLLSNQTYVDIHRDRPRTLQRGESGNDYKWYTIHGWGGGEVTYYPKVRLSTKLLDTKVGERPSKHDYTIGGVFLHEYLYHLHPLGSREDGSPQRMRNYYNIATNNHGLSGNHGAGSRTRRPYSSGELEQIERSLDEAIENEKN